MYEFNCQIFEITYDYFKAYINKCDSASAKKKSETNSAGRDWTFFALVKKRYFLISAIYHWFEIGLFPHDKQTLKLIDLILVMKKLFVLPFHVYWSVR